MGKKYLRLKEMADQYSLKERQLRKMCCRKDIKASKIGGDWFIEPIVMERFFERHANKDKKLL